MTKGRSLRAKFLLVVAVNLALLLLVVAAAVQWQLGLAFDSFLLATGREHINAVATDLMLDLAETPADARDGLLRRYSDTHGVTFVLVRNDGSRIAGAALPVPEDVVRRLRGMPPVGREPVERPRPRDDRGPGGMGPGGPRPGGPPPPFLVMARDGHPFWVGVRVPYFTREEATTISATLLIASPTLLTNPFFFRPAPWMAIAGAAVLVTLLCWLPLVRGLARSISRLMHATSEIAEGKFDVAVDTARRGVTSSDISPRRFSRWRPA